MTSQDAFAEDLLSDFLDESSQLLAQLNENLLDLDRLVAGSDAGRPIRCDEEMMNRMFRAAHSIKGLSAMLGLSNINALTHKIENVFDAARKEQIGLDVRCVDVVLRSVDRVGEMIDLLRNEGREDIDASDLSTEIRQLLTDAGCFREQRSAAEIQAGFDAVAGSDTSTSAPAAPASSAASRPVPPTAPEPIEDLLAGIVDEVDISPRYLAIFIDEAVETIESIGEALLGYDSLTPGEANEALLVTSHRLKGSAASVGLHRPAKLAHVMEDVFQDLGERQVAMNVAMIDAMFACCDALKAYVEGLRQGNADASTFSGLAHAVRVAKRQLDSETNGSSSSTESGASSAASPSSPPTAAEAASSAPPTTRGSVTGSSASRLVTVTIRFAPELPAAGMKASLIVEKLRALGSIEISDPDVAELTAQDDLREWMFAMRTAASVAEITNRCRVAGVKSCEVAVPCDATHAPTPVSTMAVSTPTAPQETKQDREVAAPATSSRSTAATVAAAAETPESVEPASPVTTEAGAAPNGSDKGRADGTAKPAETLRVDIERLDQLMNLAGQLVINKARFVQIGDSLKGSLMNKQAPQVLADARNIGRQVLQTLEDGSAIEATRLPQFQSQMRRLAADLDWLEKEFSRFNTLRNDVNDLFEAVHQLDRVADGIQQGVMDTRMVPIGPLFARFRRIVRDMTRSTGKRIDLVIHGENTELDKRMIDALGDPLIHMVRNSADHGIETPELRRESGKSESGTITLDAYHRGNQIYIEVRDDGRGLNRDRILAKAIERGLVAAADADKLSDHQIHQLIWEPGFSTAEKVTEISGRGMGMDIVRSKIEEINGTVEVSSTFGQGTTFVIKLPLTMAILPSLMAVIGKGIFAMPVESVIEIVAIPITEMRTVRGQQTARIRGRVVSVVDLQEVFRWNDPATDATTSDQTTLVIIGQEGDEVGLRVDSLLGEEDVVIKSLSENYRNVRGLAGAAILGSGQVSLILDIPALIDMASRRRATVGV
ncbi:MAG TPA: hypothetical protein DCQ98_03620 [Planctomycetaceae bacterium]|nr:hypothetical protein [Planctomycetaceae bacterium]HRF00175.1 Hpt domain-containing protein [Pirellulaceae bacterium]